MKNLQAKTVVHYATVVHPTPARIKRAMDDVEGANAKIAVFITKVVGSMWCAYAFAALALAGLPTALRPGGSGIVSWIAQTFLQLVLLSIIMVGQSVQQIASDKRAEQTYDDTEKILDRLDAHTQGGLGDILKLIESKTQTHEHSDNG